MDNNQQYQQLMLQYNQLKNGAEDIYQMIEREDFDSALSLLKAREPIFLNCKCMRKYLEMTPAQKEAADKLFDEIRELEKRNIEVLTKNIADVKLELKRTQKTEKIQNAYDFNETNSGNIVNVQE